MIIISGQGARGSMALVELIPMPGNLKHNFGIHTSTCGSIFHSGTSLLQHLVTLFLALQDSAGNFIGVKSMSIVETR